MAQQRITFSQLIDDANRRGMLFSTGRTSLNYFMTQASRVEGLEAYHLMQRAPKENLRETSQMALGKMYMYAYDPKHKATLPYYDRYPLIFPIESYKDGWLGLNMHYLPYKLRAQLMDALYDLEKGNLTENKRLAMTYGLLKDAAKYKWFKPTIKRYLSNHVRSRLMLVPYDQWNMMLFLPVHTFEKQSEVIVWNDSRNIINESGERKPPKQKKKK